MAGLASGEAQAAWSRHHQEEEHKWPSLLQGQTLVFLWGTGQGYWPNSDLTNGLTIHHLLQICLAKEHACSPLIEDVYAGFQTNLQVMTPHSQQHQHSCLWSFLGFPPAGVGRVGPSQAQQPE